MRIKFSHIICLLSSVFTGYGFASAQEFKPEYKRHRFFENVLAGHKPVVDIPLEFSFVMAQDYNYNDVDEQKNIYMLSTGVKFGFRNKWDRGVAGGVGIDWCIGEYMRYSALLDLDFLFHYIIDIGNNKKFGGSFFSKWALSSVISEKKINEYYLRINFLQLHFGNYTFSMSTNKGMFRRRFTPYFADQGLTYSVTYTFRK